MRVQDSLPVTEQADWPCPEIRQMIAVALSEGENLFGWLAALNHADDAEFAQLAAQVGGVGVDDLPREDLVSDDEDAGGGHAASISETQSRSKLDVRREPGVAYAHVAPTGRSRR